MVEPCVDGERVIVGLVTWWEPCVDGERVIVALVTWWNHVEMVSVSLSDW